MKLTPQLKFAIDSLAHGIEHYKMAKENDFVFGLIHFDAAIEMILKAILINTDRSIYKAGKRTLDLEECIRQLNDKVKIAEGENFITLHGLRNDIQHMGLLPSQETIKYYLDVALPHVKRLLKAELKVNLEDYIEPSKLAIIEGKTEEIKLDLDALATKEITTGAQNVINSYAALESLARSFDPGTTLRNSLREMARVNNLVNMSLFRNNLDTIFSIRNQIVHEMALPSQAMLKSYQESMKSISEAIQPAIIMGLMSGDKKIEMAVQNISSEPLTK